MGFLIPIFAAVGSAIGGAAASVGTALGIGGAGAATAGTAATMAEVAASAGTIGAGAAAATGGTLLGTLGTIGTIGSLALTAETLAQGPPKVVPPTALGLTAPAEAAATTPPVNPVQNKNLQAMAAEALGGTFTGAGQAQGQGKTLLGQ